ncbi:MAG TPA: hypothetical protein VF776_04400 [Sphingomicrobium sp.]
MRITITKGEREDRIEAVRADGSCVRTSFPHKGPVPHDAVHFYVESTLAIPDAFWGMVARGEDPEAIAAIAKAAGHASAARAAVPDESVIRLVQAERAVECFEADLWSGGDSGPELIRDLIAAGCAQSLVAPLELSDEAIATIRSRLCDLLGRWSAAAEGDHLRLEWELAA